MTKPIKPSEVVQGKIDSIPDEVYEIVNQQIMRQFDGTTAVLDQSDLVSLIMERMNIPRQEVFDMKYLDFEPAYREEGWGVVYEKPGWDDTWGSRFVFTKKG